MITKKQINDFFSIKEIAIAGVSRDKKKFGYQVFINLMNKDYTVYPVNPNADKIDDVKCYSTVLDIPVKINNLLILAPVHKVDEIYREAVKKGIRNIWIQQKVLSKSIIDSAEENNINLIWNKCIFMFTEPVSGHHAFHRWILKIFGKLPE